MKFFFHIFRFLIPVGLLAGAGYALFQNPETTATGRIEGLGVDLMSAPPLSLEAVDLQLNAAQQAGVKYVRLEMNWSLIESSPDVYNWSGVMPLDLFFSAVQARELQGVAVITGYPVYLSMSGQAADEKMVGERWEKFILAAAEHFGDQVNYWEIGDQINTTNGSRSLAQANPSFYAKLIRSAGKIIQSVDPNDEVWMGSLVSATAANCAVNPLTFLLEVNAAKGWNSADAVTFQPRRGAVAPEYPSSNIVNAGCGSTLPAANASLATEVQAVQDLARQLGGKPVYITGLSFGQEELISLANGRNLDLGWVHSDFLVRSTVMLMGSNTIPLVFWQFDPVLQPAVLPALTNLSNLMADSKPLGQFQGQAGSVQEYRFQKGGDLTLIAWRSLDGDAPQPVSFSGLDSPRLIAFPVEGGGLAADGGMEVSVDASGSAIVMLNERPVLFLGKTGSWDNQVKEDVNAQLENWRFDLQAVVRRWLNDQKAAFLQMVEDLFNQAKDSAVDWGEEQIHDLLN